MTVPRPSPSVTASSPPPGLAVLRGTALFDVAESTFRLLCRDPAPLSVDGARFGLGLPRRPIRLTELSAVLMHPATSFEARDAVWRLLVAQARTAGPAWVVGAVGVALPGLRSVAGRLVGRAAFGDVQAEVLTGFLAALGTTDVDGPRVCPRLCNAAHVSARAALRSQEPPSSGEGRVAAGSALPPQPHGHPDFVLARAVRRGVITVAEAELIGVTRLESRSLTAHAASTGSSRWALYKRRTSAESRLVKAIGSGALSDPHAETVAEATGTLHHGP